MTSQPPTSGGLGRLGRLVRKELRESLRDRRTLITLLVMPLLLYPLLSLVFRQFLLLGDGEAAARSIKYNLATATEEEARHLLALLLAGEPRQRGAAGEPPIEFKIYSGAEPEENLRQGQLQLVVKLTPPGEGAAASWLIEVVYRRESETSRAALAEFKERVARASLLEFAVRLQRHEGRPPPPPVRLRDAALPAEESKGFLSLKALLPLILILMTITGAVYPAIDLTAGERERGTLEMLMAAPTPRVGLLLAKYVAVVTVALLTGVANLGMMWLTVTLSGLGPQLFGPEGLPVGTALAVLGLLLLFAAFFAAVLLVLTSFARSFKEAQAYLIPLMMMSIGPGLLVLAPGLTVNSVLAAAPLLNVVLLGRGLLLEENVHPLAAAVVIGSTLCYAAVALFVASRVFGAEAVLYHDTGGWFRRRRSR